MIKIRECELRTWNDFLDEQVSELEQEVPILYNNFKIMAFIC